MDSINFGIVGFGSIAKTHALASFDANLRFNLPFSLNLTNVVTKKPQEIKLMNVKNNLDIEEILEDKNVHFISICTPNEYHLEIVEKACKYNKPVYCEKPLASSVMDAAKMSELVKMNNIKNAVALMYRFIPAVRLLKREITKGTIGDIIDFKIKTYHKSYLSDNKKGSWRTLKSSGGGALLDLGVHLIDLVNFTISDIVKVSADTRIYFSDRSFVDEIAFCKFQLENGVEGSLEVSRIFAERDQRDVFEVFGTKGSIKINFKNPYEIEMYDNKENMTKIIKTKVEDEEMKYYPEERNCLGFFQSAHTASIINFSTAIYNNSNVGIAATFEDALKCQKIIDMVYNG